MANRPAFSLIPGAYLSMAVCLATAEIFKCPACFAQTYIAHYSANYSDVTPKSYYKVEQDYYDYLTTHGNPPWAANLAGNLQYEKSQPSPPPIKYRVLVGKNGADILCAISCSARGQLDVMVYSGNSDCTYYLHREAGSIGTVSIDRGLNTWNLPFVPLTGMSSPFIKRNESTGEYAYPFPLKAAPPRSTPGEYTKLLYEDAKLVTTAGSASLTTSDPKSGNTRFIWKFTDSSAGRTQLPQQDIANEIQRYDYSAQPTKPFSLNQKTFVSVPQGLWTAHLDNINNTNVDPALFQISHWLNRADSITDNRHAVVKIASYESSYGGIDDQLYRPDDRYPGLTHPKGPSASVPGILVSIIGLGLALAWVLYRRRKAST